MRYAIVHRATLSTGETVEKWFPSSDYEQMARHLLSRIEAEPRWLDWLAVPFVLTLAASLEANLNDWLTLASLRQHGRAHYKPILDAYLRCSFSKKLRLTVAALTENHFHLDDSSATARTLDELIAVRNKVTHPNADFYVVPADPKARRPKRPSHPVQDLTLAACKKYNAAVEDFETKFFRQYDKGSVSANDVIIYNTTPTKGSKRPRLRPVRKK